MCFPDLNQRKFLPCLFFVFVGTSSIAKFECSYLKAMLPSDILGTFSKPLHYRLFVFVQQFQLLSIVVLKTSMMSDRKKLQTFLWWRWCWFPRRFRFGFWSWSSRWRGWRLWGWRWCWLTWSGFRLGLRFWGWFSRRLWNTKYFC